jgi:shikimate kinase
MIKINIYLIGMMGSGKTTIGQELAGRLNVPLVELDQAIEQAGMSIPEIFETYGEEHFRDMETEAVRSTTAHVGAVISTGGGVILRPDNINMMKENGYVVYLKGNTETLTKNLTKGRDSRPLLKEGDLREKVCSLMAVRAEKYRMASTHVVEVDGLTPAGIADEIIKQLKL